MSWMSAIGIFPCFSTTYRHGIYGDFDGLVGICTLDHDQWTYLSRQPFKLHQLLNNRLLHLPLTYSGMGFVLYVGTDSIQKNRAWLNCLRLLRLHTCSTCQLHIP